MDPRFDLQVSKPFSKELKVPRKFAGPFDLAHLENDFTAFIGNGALLLRRLCGGSLNFKLWKVVQ